MSRPADEGLGISRIATGPRSEREGARGMTRPTLETSSKGGGRQAHEREPTTTTEEEATR